MGVFATVNATPQSGFHLAFRGAVPDVFPAGSRPSFTMVLRGVRRADNSANRWFFEIPNVMQLRDVIGGSPRLEWKVWNSAAATTTHSINGDLIADNDAYWIFLTWNGTNLRFGVRSDTTGTTTWSTNSTFAGTGWGTLSGTDWGFGKVTASTGSDKAVSGLFGSMAIVGRVLSDAECDAIADGKVYDWWTGETDANLSCVFPSAPSAAAGFATLAAGTHTGRAFVDGVTADDMLATCTLVVTADSVEELDPFQTDAGHASYDARVAEIITTRRGAADDAENAPTYTMGQAACVRRWLDASGGGPYLFCFLGNSRSIRDELSQTHDGVPWTYTSAPQNFADGVYMHALDAVGESATAGGGRVFLPLSSSALGNHRFHTAAVTTGTANRTQTKGASRLALGGNAAGIAGPGQPLYLEPSSTWVWRRLCTGESAPVYDLYFLEMPFGAAVTCTPEYHTAATGGPTATGTPRSVNLGQAGTLSFSWGVVDSFDDDVAGNQLRITATAAALAIRPGMLCYLEGGTADKDVNRVASVVQDGVHVVVTFDFDFDTQGWSVFDNTFADTFHFGAWRVRRERFTLTESSQDWRGVKVTTPAGTARTWILAVVAFDQAKASGAVFVPVGTSGWGYGEQRSEAFGGVHAAWAAALQPDALFVHPATQDDASNTGPMIDAWLSGHGSACVVLVGPEEHQPTSGVIAGSTAYPTHEEEFRELAAARGYASVYPVSLMGSWSSQCAEASRADSAHLSAIGVYNVAARTRSLLDQAVTALSAGGGGGGSAGGGSGGGGELGFLAVEQVNAGVRVSVAGRHAVQGAGSGASIGVSVYDTPAGSMCLVRLWNSSGEYLVRASEAVEAGDLLYAASDGGVQDTVSGPAIGQAVEDAAAGSLVRMAPVK